MRPQIETVRLAIPINSSHCRSSSSRSGRNDYECSTVREEEERQVDELMGIANRTDFDLRTHSKKRRTRKGSD